MSYYHIKGLVKGKDGQFGARQLFLINRDSGVLLDSTTSDPTTGEYTLRSPTGDALMVICRPANGETSNAKIWDMIVPQSVEYTAAELNNIGVPGDRNFGVGIAPFIPPGFSAMPGFDDIYSPNFGNYKVVYDDSIMVWIPAFYYKWGSGSNGVSLNVVDIKRLSHFADPTAAAVSGYAIHRAFIDGGKIQPGFFVDKYMNGKNPNLNVASSHYLLEPMNISSQNPISQLGNGVDNVFGGTIAAAKLRGNGFHVLSCFMANAIFVLSYAHGKASSSTQFCGWYGTSNNFPKGNTAAGNAKTFDSTLRMFEGVKYGNVALSGGYSQPEKATHNGQKCGVSGVAGEYWDATAGVTFTGGRWRVIPETFSMRNGTNETTGVNGFFSSAALVDVTAHPFSGMTGNAWYYLNPTTQMFSGETNRSSVGYLTSCFGIPQPGNTSSSNPNIVGGGIYLSNPLDCMPCYFGSYNDGADAGVSAVNLTASRTISSAYSGFRSAFYPL